MKAPKVPLSLLILAWLAGCTQIGCMQAIPQPGQTPAQVQACTVDATAHNVLIGTAGGLSTGAGVESAIATSTDPNTSKGLVIGAAVTAGVAAIAVGAGTLFAQAYNNDGCAPSLPAKPKPATARGFVQAPVSGADGYDYRFGELGWTPIKRTDQ